MPRLFGSVVVEEDAIAEGIEEGGVKYLEVFDSVARLMGIRSSAWAEVAVTGKVSMLRE